jgi:hypothetical protein
MLTSLEMDRQTDRQRDRETERETSIRTGWRFRNGQAGRQRDRAEDEQKYRLRG